MSLQKRREDVFLVRVWREPSNDREPDLRGSAFHAPSGRRFYFSDLEALRRYFASEVADGETEQERC
ncbi:MAG TPA: hypothetical protein VGX96_08335 [Candidatus Elarobacter sp.]|jgi:hypothetical protein|nr:hypothetical protein [Candidatus Elarobacter sp.]